MMYSDIAVHWISFNCGFYYIDLTFDGIYLSSIKVENLLYGRFHAISVYCRALLPSINCGSNHHKGRVLTLLPTRSFSKIMKLHVLYVPTNFKPSIGCDPVSTHILRRQQ